MVIGAALWTHWRAESSRKARRRNQTAEQGVDDREARAEEVKVGLNGHVQHVSHTSREPWRHTCSSQSLQQAHT